MSNSTQTLFEIIESVLSQFNDANLKSDEARKIIADAICDKYYSEIDIPIGEYDDVNFGTHIANDDFMQEGE